MQPEAPTGAAQPEVDESEEYPNESEEYPDKIWVDPEMRSKILSGDVESLRQQLHRHPTGSRFIAILETTNGNVPATDPFRSLVAELVCAGEFKISGKVALVIPYDNSEANKMYWAQLGASVFLEKYVSAIHLYFTEPLPEFAGVVELFIRFRDQFGGHSLFLRSLTSLTFTCTWSSGDPHWLDRPTSEDEYRTQIIEYAPKMKIIWIYRGTEPPNLETPANEHVWDATKDQNSFKFKERYHVQSYHDEPSVQQPEDEEDSQEDMIEESQARF